MLEVHFFFNLVTRCKDLDRHLTIYLYSFNSFMGEPIALKKQSYHFKKIVKVLKKWFFFTFVSEFCKIRKYSNIMIHECF